MENFQREIANALAEFMQRHPELSKVACWELAKDYLENLKKVSIQKVSE